MTIKIGLAVTFLKFFRWEPDTSLTEISELGHPLRGRRAGTGEPPEVLRLVASFRQSESHNFAQAAARALRCGRLGPVRV